MVEKQEDKKLVKKIRVLKTKLKLLNEYIVCSENKDRKKIATKLHDGTLQSLALSISKIKDLKELAADTDSINLSEIQEYLEQAVIETRTVINQLYPPALNSLDISHALEFLIQENNNKYQDKIKYINNVTSPILLDKEIKVALYKLVKEIINKIIKQFGKKNIVIEVVREDKIIIRINNKHNEL